jgi:hypothetical protein
MKCSSCLFLSTLSFPPSSSLVSRISLKLWAIQAWEFSWALAMEWVGNEVEEVGGGKLLGQRRGLKNPWAREEDVFLVHPQNSLNGLILNSCTGGCWFAPTRLETCHNAWASYGSCN